MNTHPQTRPLPPLDPNASVRVALVQICAGRSVDENLATTSSLIAEAARTGASYIQTPEVTTLITADRDELQSQTAPEAGNPAVRHFSELAARLNIWLHIGSMPVRIDGDERLANRSFLFAPDGRQIATYDKIHMFDVDIGKDDRYWESRRYRGGDTTVIAPLPWGNLGLTICYDLRFPALYRDLAQAGAHIIAVPSAFTVPTGEAHWHTLLRARAIESQCYILAAAQAGHHASGRHTYGHSLMVSPWGEILADAGDLQNTFVSADIRHDAVVDARRRIPSLTHDRPYRITIADTGRAAKPETVHTEKTAR